MMDKNLQLVDCKYLIARVVRFIDVLEICWSLYVVCIQDENFCLK